MNGLYERYLHHVLSKTVLSTAERERNCLAHKVFSQFLEQRSLILSSHDFNYRGIKTYGSFVNGTALSSSDLDLSVNGDHRRQVDTFRLSTSLFRNFTSMSETELCRHSILRRPQLQVVTFPNYSGGYDSLLRFHNLTLLDYAGLPLTVDLSFNKEKELLSGSYLQKYFNKFENCRLLCMLVKLWVLRLPKRFRLPTFAYYLMVIHYLQDNHHLPKLSFSGAGSDKLEQWPEGEQLGLHELLQGFFLYYGHQFGSDRFNRIINICSEAKAQSYHNPNLDVRTWMEIIDPASQGSVVKDNSRAQGRFRIFKEQMQEGLSLIEHGQAIFKGFPFRHHNISPKKSKKAKSEENSRALTEPQPLSSFFLKEVDLTQQLLVKDLKFSIDGINLL